MTQPSAPPQATQQQVAQVTAILAAGAPLAAEAKTLGSVLGLPGPLALLLLTLNARYPTQVLPAGPSGTVVNKAELTYRAAYLANAGLRMKGRLDSGATPDAAAEPERALFRAHRAAQAGRARASAAVDSLAKRVGLRLRWKAVNDAKTSPECRAASGHTFTADRPPVIGLPGAVHPNCRCSARPAAEGSGTTTVDQAVQAARASGAVSEEAA